MAEIKVTTKDVEDKVKFKGKLVWDRYDGNQVEEAFGFAEEYKQFLNKAKTEREVLKKENTKLKMKPPSASTSGECE